MSVIGSQKILITKGKRLSDSTCQIQSILDLQVNAEKKNLKLFNYTDRKIEWNEVASQTRQLFLSISFTAIDSTTKNNLPDLEPITAACRLLLVKQNKKELKKKIEIQLQYLFFDSIANKQRNVFRNNLIPSLLAFKFVIMSSKKNPGREFTVRQELDN